MKINKWNLKKSLKVIFGLLLTIVIIGGGIGVVGYYTGKHPGAVQSKKQIYTCPMHHQIRKEQPGECPICGMTLIPIEQVFGTTTDAPTPENTAKPQEKKIKYWAAPMNPAIHSDKPKKDEMGMDYVPVYEEETPASATPSREGATKSPEKKVKYWMNPMNPTQRSDKPMKAPDGMDYVPVYEEGESTGSGAPEEIQGLAPVHLSPYKEQLIGVRFTTVEKSAITHVIHTNGRFGGGEGGFANLATEFAAGQPTRAVGRYVVADVYALDIPLVKVGQKAWVGPLSGSGPKVEGKVAEIYPYDSTQSRIVRVRIKLLQPLPGQIFADVDIEAVTEPRTAVSPTAVMDTGTKQYVFVATGAGVLTPKAVTVGFHGDNLWEVKSGLEPGDKVVDGAVFMIDADSKIQSAFQEK